VEPAVDVEVVTDHLTAVVDAAGHGYHGTQDVDPGELAAVEQETTPVRKLERALFAVHAHDLTAVVVFRASVARAPRKSIVPNLPSLCRRKPCTPRASS
jgi:hypothetical protein